MSRRGRARFAAWTRALRVQLRRQGAELVLDAPHGAELAGWPAVTFDPWGRHGDARFELRIGRDVTIGRGVTLELFPRGGNRLALGDGAKVGDFARLQLRGGSIDVGGGTVVRAHVILKADGAIVLGERVEVSYFTVVHCAGRVEVRDRAGIAERVSILDSDHALDGSDTHFYEAPLTVEPVTIGENVFVAANAVVTRGTVLGANSVVAAGAVLTGSREYAPGSLVAGVPARLIRDLRAG